MCIGVQEAQSGTKEVGKKKCYGEKPPKEMLLRKENLLRRMRFPFSLPGEINPIFSSPL